MSLARNVMDAVASAREAAAEQARAAFADLGEELPRTPKPVDEDVIAAMRAAFADRGRQ
ncbi:hypothetical protein [Actinopolymorpha pittospori]|uniref:Uncharacterized protein n=1 Tax=Actinopolymorpha pittospori TaxID=648752 RepID=A0A927R7S4_9ACTN|nr:hypothetical protein [Actinopolymorpha pittospori]MBE1604549.1 hypothetical protein [Actinopolymorpha pittospori]